MHFGDSVRGPGISWTHSLYSILGILKQHVYTLQHSNQLLEKCIMRPISCARGDKQPEGHFRILGGLIPKSVAFV